MSAPGVGGDGAGRSHLGDAWVNFKRWNRKAIRNPFVLVVSLVQPIVTLVTFGLIFGGAATLVLEDTGYAGVGYVAFVVPAVLMQVSLASALTSGLGVVDDIQSGMFEKVLVTPMSPAGVFAGKALSEFLRIVVQVLLVLGLGLALGGTLATGLAGVVGIVAVCLLVALWFMAVSNVLALLTRDEESLSASQPLLQFPLLFLSTAFLPLSALPGWIQAFAAVNPVTYGVDAVRALVLGRDVMTVVEVTRFGGVYDTLVPAVVVLVGLDVLFGGVAVVLLGRASSAAAD